MFDIWNEELSGALEFSWNRHKDAENKQKQPLSDLHVWVGLVYMTGEERERMGIYTLSVRDPSTSTAFCIRSFLGVNICTYSVFDKPGPEDPCTTRCFTVPSVITCMFSSDYIHGHGFKGIS